VPQVPSGYHFLIDDGMLAIGRILSITGALVCRYKGKETFVRIICGGDSDLPMKIADSTIAIDDQDAGEDVDHLLEGGEPDDDETRKSDRRKKKQRAEA
jgi:hypothetical protein